MLFKGVHAKAPELLAFVIAEDIVNNLNRRMIKTSLQSYVKELSKEFTGDVRVDWKGLIPISDGILPILSTILIPGLNFL